MDPGGRAGGVGLPEPCASGASSKRAARFGDRALGVPQLVARLRAAFFGLRDFRAQAFDARSEGVELFRFALGERRGRDEREHCAKQATHATEWRQERP